jgi:hypothetical protein
MSDFKIEKVEPVKGTKSVTDVYRKAVNAMAKEPLGWYKITIENKKATTLYQQLHKIIKEKDLKDLKLHKVNNLVYIEKVAIDKPVKK